MLKTTLASGVVWGGGSPGLRHTWQGGPGCFTGRAGFAWEVTHVSYRSSVGAPRRLLPGPDPRTAHTLHREAFPHGFELFLNKRGGVLITSLWSEPLACLPSVIKRMSVRITCHLRLSDKLAVAAVGTCGFFNSDALVLPTQLVLCWC